MAKCYHLGSRCKAAVFLPAGGGCWLKAESPSRGRYRKDYRVLSCKSGQAPPPAYSAPRPSSTGVVSLQQWTRDWGCLGYLYWGRLGLLVASHWVDLLGLPLLPLHLLVAIYWSDLLGLSLLPLRLLVAIFMGLTQHRLVAIYWGYPYCYKSPFYWGYLYIYWSPFPGVTSATCTSAARNLLGLPLPCSLARAHRGVSASTVITDDLSVILPSP